MRKGIKHITSVLCGVSLLTAGTAGAQALLEYDSASHKLAISGIMDDEKAVYATFSVLPLEVNPDKLNENSPELANALYKTVALSVDGGFDETVILPSDFKPGEYVLRSYGSSLDSMCYFAIASSDASLGDLSAINGASSASKLLDAMKILEKIPFDKTILGKYGKNTADYIFSNRPSAGYDVQGLINAYYNALALIRTENGEITPGDALLMYSAYADADYEKEYSSLSDKEKSTLAKLFTNKHGVDGSFSDVYTDLKLTAELINSPSFDKLQEKYLAYADEKGISLKAYNSLPTDYSRDKAFISVFSDIAGVKNMDDVTELFASAVENAADSSSGGSSGGSGSGGGKGSSGGSSGGATYIPAEAPVQEAAFRDTAGHWAEEYILTLKESGVVNGNENRLFRPDDTISRAEFVKMICALLGISPADGNRFADVSDSEWFAGYVYGAYNAGIINGTGANEFSPYSHITRQDAAVIINRACNLAGGGQLSFADRGEIADYATEAVANLAKAGIIGGYEDNTVRPLSHLTRAETAAILCRIKN